MDDEEDPLADLVGVVDGILSAALTATKSSNAVLGSNDHEFLSSFPPWSAEASKAEGLVIRLLRDLLKHLDFPDDHLDEGMDVNESDLYSPFGECITQLLDQIDVFLAANKTDPESAAMRRRIAQLNNKFNKHASAAQAAMVRAPKPQDAPTFAHSGGAPPDNRRDTPFMPRPFDGRALGAPVPRADGSGADFPHPFARELADLAYTPEQLEAPRSPRPRPPLLKASAGGLGAGWTWVDSPETLDQLARALAATSGPLALDLEHHSFRSFGGLTCLVQATVDGHDFLVDCLAPSVRPRLGAALGPALANPPSSRSSMAPTATCSGSSGTSGATW
jgi:hypothetical protein